jgi:hypothetical protein
LSAVRAAAELRRIRPDDQVGNERRRLAGELLTEVRTADRDLLALKVRIASAVNASSTTVTDVVGVGPTMAAYLIGYSGDVRRFPTAGHYARSNGTPIEASSGPRVRHRLNPRGNRQLNHAVHIAAVTQVRNDTPGHAYYLRKQAEGKTKQEALRALTRRISDTVYRQLLADTIRRSRPGRATRERLSHPAWPAQSLNTGTSERPLPDQPQRYAEPPLGSIGAPKNRPLTQTGFALAQIRGSLRRKSRRVASGRSTRH